MGGPPPRSNAKRNQTMGIENLKDTLSKIGVLPKREFESTQEFKTYFEKHKILILDVTEQRVQRPKTTNLKKSIILAKKMSYCKSNGHSEQR